MVREWYIAAESLLDLAAVGNGLEFCEPYSGTLTLTDLSMADLERMEAEQSTTTIKNELLLQECERLKEENIQLKMQNHKMQGECEMLKKECEQLRSKPNQYCDEETFGRDDARLKYYTYLPTFSTLMAVFTFVAAPIQSSNTHLSLFQQFILL